MSPATSLLRDILLALRWAYYCKAKSVVSDYEYDMLEFEYKESPDATPLPVGSSNPEDYPVGVRGLGLYLLLGGTVPKRSKPQDML